MDSKFLGLNPVMYQLQPRKAKPCEFSGFKGLVVGSYLKISLASLYPFRVILIHHALCKLSLQLHPPLYLFFMVSANNSTQMPEVLINLF